MRCFTLYGINEQNYPEYFNDLLSACILPGHSGSNHADARKFRKRAGTGIFPKIPISAVYRE